LKNISEIRLYRPDSGESGDGAAAAHAQLGPVLTRPIRWELIGPQYDQMVKYVTALRLGTGGSGEHQDGGVVGVEAPGQPPRGPGSQPRARLRARSR
jgi:hypothetical protein